MTAASNPAAELTEAEVEAACEVMHDAYEAAATETGWETQMASREAWADVPEANKATMRIAVRALLAARLAADGAATDEGLRALAAEAIEAVGGSHSHWRKGGAGGACRTCDDATRLRADLRARLDALAAPAPTEDASWSAYPRTHLVGDFAEAADTAAEEPRTEALLSARRFAEAQAVTARARGSEAERDWLDLLHLLDRADEEAGS